MSGEFRNFAAVGVTVSVGVGVGVGVGFLRSWEIGLLVKMLIIDVWPASLFQD